MVYTHSSHVCLLSTHMEVMFAYLPYLSMLTRSCLAQLCALYKSKTKKITSPFCCCGRLDTLWRNSPSHPPYNSYVTIIAFLFFILSHILNSSIWNHYHLHHYKSSEQYWISSPANETTG